MSSKKQEYQGLEGKYVKVLHQDGDKHATFKGILIKETTNTVIIKGDFTELHISKNAIIKISRQEQRGQENEINF